MRTTQHERTEYKPIWKDLPILIQITPNPLMFMLIYKYLGRYLSLERSYTVKDHGGNKKSQKFGKMPQMVKEESYHSYLHGFYIYI